MNVSEIMSRQVITVDRSDTVESAAGLLEHYNIGALPVCNGRGKLCGMVTDRDLVTRCLAAGRSPKHTRVSRVMSRSIASVTPETEVGDAAGLMGRLKVRRLPVTEEGKLCGVVSLGDLATCGEDLQAATHALGQISDRLST